MFYIYYKFDMLRLILTATVQTKLADLTYRLLSNWLLLFQKVGI